MFERLATKLLSRLLSKYFVPNDPSDGSSTTKTPWTNLDVWSGYISLEGLELRKEVVNRYFRSKGLPFELLQCTLGRVEITVPWGKLGLSSSSSSSSTTDADDAVVVVVVDGVHALLRTNYEFDDEALREAAVQQRRQELQDSEAFGKEPEKTGGWSGFLHRSITEGILKDILEKLHLHLRDIHVRFEDVESDPLNPCACGVTLESLHVQGDQNVMDATTEADTSQASEVIRKVAQLNHFAIYWNALDYGEGLPTELSILQDTMHSSTALSKALDRCIARRASSLSSPLRNKPVQNTPNHTFLLLPLDATCHATLSTNPKKLESGPALVIFLHIEDVSLQLRDFQCSQISVFISVMKEHAFAKNYRKYRPLVSAKENPRAWWDYALRIIRMELSEQGKTRWSWSRFEQRYALRRRYCELYERNRRNPIHREQSRVSKRVSVSPVDSMAPIPSQDSISDSAHIAVAPDEGAGPSMGPSNNGASVVRLHLSPDEKNELQEMEDGLRGDLSVHDVVLFRALINARVAAANKVLPQRRSRVRRLMSSMVSEDIESEEEYARLLSYLEHAGSDGESASSPNEAALVAVSIEVHLYQGCISLFTPLRSTEDLNQHRRIQRRFLDVSTVGFQVGYSIFGNYESFRVEASLEDFVGSEIRSDTKTYSIISRVAVNQGILEPESNFDTPPTSNRDTTGHKPLVYLDIQGSPPDNDECDVRIHAAVQASEIILLPDGEWFRNIETLFSTISTKKSLSKYWEEISMAQINLLYSARAGLLAKADAAIFKHKNIDVDINVNCPVIRISDGNESILTVDLGNAHLTTERLAGVATGKLRVSSFKSPAGVASNLVDEISGAGTDLSLTGSTNSAKFTPNPQADNSPRRILDRSFLGSSAISVLGNRSTRSITDNAAFADFDGSGNNYPNPMLQGLHSSFYDEFRLHLDNACMFISEENDTRQSTLMNRLQIHVAIKKSVIPSDHTLCRLKTQWLVKDVNFCLSESIISCLVGLTERWIKTLTSEAPSASYYVPSASRRESSISLRSALPRFNLQGHPDLLETASDESSALDENEFVDALESDDHDDNSGAWFDDNWIADAESVIESDTRSVPQKRPRRRLRSMSDVSSISDKSWGRQRQIHDEYLSAENLARLEERGAEDDDSELGSDEDSFQSALSLGGQEALLSAVQEDITRAENEIAELKKNVRTETNHIDASPLMAPDEIKRRRQIRRKQKVDLDRAEAELRALRALREDFVSNLDSVRSLDYDEGPQTDEVEDTPPDPIIRDIQMDEDSDLAARAKALLRARRQRSSSIASGEAFKHGLTRGLNRELLNASVVVLKVGFTIEGLEGLSENVQQHESPTLATFDFSMTRCALVLIRRAKESRLYASVDSIVATMKNCNTAAGPSGQQLLLGGVRPSFLDDAFGTLPPAGEGQRVAPLPLEEKFLRLSIDRSEKGKSDRSCTRATKMRIHVGDVDVSPREQAVSSLVHFFHKIIEETRRQKANSITKPPNEPSPPLIRRICNALNGIGSAMSTEGGSGPRGNLEYSDVSVQLSSFRVNLSDGDDSVGSYVLTAIGVRLLSGSTGTVFTHRCQLDMRCNNVQIIRQNSRGSTLELLGCRDPYSPIAQLRIRTQLAPLTHTGGWVVGETSKQADAEEENGRIAWNKHIGAKLNSVHATATTKGIDEIIRSTRELIDAFIPLRSSTNARTKTVENVDPNLDNSTLLRKVDVSEDSPAETSLVPIRWRADFASGKVSILFPAYDVHEIDALEAARSNVLLTFFVNALLQAAEEKAGYLSLRSRLSDVCLVRTSDDWPILESTNVTSDITFLQRNIVSSSCQLCVMVPEAFSWKGNRIPSLNNGQTDGIDVCGQEGLKYALLATISTSPIRFNLTAQTCCLLRTALSALGKRAESANFDANDKESHVKATSEPSAIGTSGLEPFGYSGKLSIESFEVRLLRESGRSTSISFADPLSSLLTCGVLLTSSHTMARKEVTLCVDQLSVDDLSSLPGVRVFGTDNDEKWTTGDDTVEWHGSDAKASAPKFALFSFSQARKAIPSTDVRIRLGRIQCLLLPSILQSLLTFKDDIYSFSKEKVEKISHSKKDEKGFVLPSGGNDLDFAFDVTGFECILSSRDLFAYIRSRSNDSISVVTFRWKSSLSGKVSFPDIKSLVGQIPGASLDSVDDSGLVSRAMDANELSLSAESQSARCVTAHAQLSVDDFQVLRTNVKRRPFPRSAAGDTHVSPCCFEVHPPLAGEQRITNPFWFKVSYQLAVASRGTLHRNEADADGIDDVNQQLPHSEPSIAQSLHVDAGFVDVLVYVRQSSGGMNDALRVTVNPIMDMLKRGEDSDSAKSKPEDNGAGSRLPQFFRQGTTICSLESEGIQVTCVPGGATRLTESPIAKCELSGLRLGLVAAALPVDLKLALAGSGPTSHVSAIERIRQAGLERFGVVEPVVSGGPGSHLTLGGWVQGELSASYHNRRLVAWEPFVEPWVIKVRIGVDLVRACKIEPSRLLDETNLNSENKGMISSVIGEGINEKAGERIRDIGRLLRAPFSPQPTSRKIENDTNEGVTLSVTDLSYVVIKSMAPRAVASALYPVEHAGHGRPDLDKIRTQNLSYLPSDDPVKWLELFGYPSMAHHGAKREPAAVVCSISDTRPLNVNITGALIENVLGFLGGGKEESGHPVAPHLIRNLSGLTVRVQECLDVEQLRRGESAKKTTLSNGCEIPLSLKRSLSQSCDPHRAFITLELGSFEDTAGRINHRDYDITAGSRSTIFFYNAMGKIPVDTVGVHKYALRRQFEKRPEKGGVISSASQDLGDIIVRVSLQGATKMVSIESPLILKNNAEIDLLCELRNHGGVSLLWRSLVPKASTPATIETHPYDRKQYVSIPADLVGTASSSEATLSVCALPLDSSIKHESDIPQGSMKNFVSVVVPPPFSAKSVARGLIRVFETSLDASGQKTSRNQILGTRHSEFVNVNICAVRIGSVSPRNVPTYAMESTSSVILSTVPEQRMLLFRPPFVIRNHLPVTIIVQARVKSAPTGRRRLGASSMKATDSRGNGTVTKGVDTEWNDLGILGCGESLSWTGATAADKIEMRVQLSDKQGEHSRKFEHWSTTVVIPSENSPDGFKKQDHSGTSMIGQMTVFDEAGATLRLSVSLEFAANTTDSDYARREDIRWFVGTLPAAPRVIGVYVPFWIIDSTSQDLEFMSNTVIAGQSSRCLSASDTNASWEVSKHGSGAHLGLAGLLEDEKLSYLSARPSFDVLMIGDMKSTRLSVRRHMTRMYDESEVVSNWCDPISLRVQDDSYCDVFVPPPSIGWDERDYAGEVSEHLEPLALRTRILGAPEEFGGMHGTKLIHVVSRYRVVNEMGRDIELISEYGEGPPMVLGADGRPIPFHFDGISPIRFRPKEFGWAWSGRFSITKKRREVTLRLVHKLKGQVIIAEVEFIDGKNSAGNVLVFREASRAPFRLENQTMQALHFAQSSLSLDAEKGRLSGAATLDSTLLPYHTAAFAWDEPDDGRRSLVIEVSDLCDSGDHGIQMDRRIIGYFELDRAAPGTEVRLSNRMYSGHILADGPTRVLRITDSTLPPLPNDEVAVQSSNDVFKKPETDAVPPSLFEVRLMHGIGISIVDWSPQELLYVRLDEFTIERRVDSRHENLAIGISCISVDNQLWVTPFPVLLRMGRRMRVLSSHHPEKFRRRRNNAIALSWRRTLNTHGGLTLVDSLELSTEPFVLNVDGYLSELLWKMTRKVKRIREGIQGASIDTQSRDAELLKALRIGKDRQVLLGITVPNMKLGSRNGLGIDIDERFFATSAVAAKLRVKPRSETTRMIRRSQAYVDKQNARQALLSKQRNKYYVGRWKLSTVKGEISWSGPLPSAFIKVPDIVRPALTFESLPVLFRPFSGSHAYGTVEDLVHDFKSHYFSFWRLLDILVGLAFRPTFLIRACVYTWRESCASVFDSISNAFTDTEKGLIRMAEPDALSPVLSNEVASIEPLRNDLSTQAYSIVVGGSLLATASFFHGSARFTSAVSSALRYGGSRQSRGRNPASGSVRARNPRLFAHVDGKDLLVEYVEGESAGKAILSRVRMGLHLGEGYVFHCEGVHLQTAKAQAQTDLDSTPLICMVTSERVFLLNGDRHQDFCSVVWESTFLNLIELEIDGFEDSTFDLVKMWYLADATHATGNTDDRLTRYAKAMVADRDWGLDVLLCKSIFVPKASGEILRSRIAAVHESLDDNINESQ